MQDNNVEVEYTEVELDSADLSVETLEQEINPTTVPPIGTTD